MTDIERLLAESAARALIARYARCVDDRQGREFVEELFAADAVVVTGPLRHRGHAEIRQWYESFSKARPGKHIAGNTLVTVESADRAVARSDWIFLKRDSGEKAWALPLAGRYDDAFERRGGTWQFVHREITLTD